MAKAEEDIRTAQGLFGLGHYNWCLFIWHLVIEKMLKALILSQGKEILYIHDLVRLAKHTNLLLSPELMDQLREITTYNLEARYDDYKLAFYQKVTKAYTIKWVATCEAIYTYLHTHIHD